MNAVKDRAVRGSSERRKISDSEERATYGRTVILLYSPALVAIHDTSMYNN